MDKYYSPNDNRSDQLKKNKVSSGINKAHKSALDNRANQLNPNNPLYKGGRKK